MKNNNMTSMECWKAQRGPVSVSQLLGPGEKGPSDRALEGLAKSLEGSTGTSWGGSDFDKGTKVRKNPMRGFEEKLGTARVDRQRSRHRGFGQLWPEKQEMSRLGEKFVELIQTERSEEDLGGPEAMPDFTLDDILRLKSTLVDFEKVIDEVNVPSGGKGLTKPGMFIYELLGKANIVYSNKNIIVDMLEKIVGYITADGKTLSYWCFSPGHSMSDLLAHGINPFPVRLENPHVIQKHQVWVGTLKKGPDGTTLNSNFETRFTVSYQAALGNSIVNFAREVPNGLLIFFPSYPVMEKCLEQWKLMNDFYSKINDPSLNGAIFIAVCRGKVSEGLDFSDTNGRAVVITGLPYPPYMDPKVVLKMQYLDEMKGKQGFQSLSGKEWYRQQASRAVNQAIGRLPVWVRPRCNKYEAFGLAVRDLMVFFKHAEKLKRDGDVTEKETKAAVSSKQLNTAENYISEVKASLGKESSGYKQFSSALVQYKKSEDIESVCNVITEVFVRQGHFPQLFAKFYRFVRPKHKERFSELCQQITGLSTGYKTEDSVSRKRLQETELGSGAFKKQKTDSDDMVKNSKEGAKTVSLEKTNHVKSSSSYDKENGGTVKASASSDKSGCLSKVSTQTTINTSKSTGKPGSTSKTVPCIRASLLPAMEAQEPSNAPVSELMHVLVMTDERYLRISCYRLYMLQMQSDG
ncbi:RTEL1-like protein [Mya arenaria]|uniref:RTEL1-like protein n=1 Tax=Mya arenaria TaxID=6604 RepID=A0ABY7FRA1_MYAAR|nr:RTEL1-like protein [Mya arenaria]